jgi:putative SOS response-associated peptidase YedK
MCNEAARLRALGEISTDFSQLRIPLVFPEGAPNLAATDSIRITDPAAIVRHHDGAYQLVQRRWSWAGPSAGGKPSAASRAAASSDAASRAAASSDAASRAAASSDAASRAAASSGRPVYNYRSDGRRFVNSASQGRCLIPLDGFYEFTAADAGAKRKTKWLFTMPVGSEDRGLFCVAGLWRTVGGDPAPPLPVLPANAGMTGDGAATPRATEAFTMLTCDPGADIAPYHSRQIVIMPREHWRAWLDGAEGLIAPTRAGTLRVARVA